SLGLLHWLTPSGERVRRHLLVADASLEFDAKSGRFTARPHSDGAKLRPELDMLDIGDQPQGAEEAAKLSLLEAADDPWERECVEGVLKALVHSIRANGQYDESAEPRAAQATEKPILQYAPALILRKRSTKGL